MVYLEPARAKGVFNIRGMGLFDLDLSTVGDLFILIGKSTSGGI